jgi:hypothetical protein
MAMKPIAVFVVVAAFSLASVAVTARTVTTTPRSANEQSVNGVAGPPPKKVVTANDKSSAQPSKKALKKTKVTPPPPLHDPN